eukprot:GHUV01055651.1.p2 GENE.GHUV01055651.1~~GHUV01055651.1.p2  ORF type:complete len:135 (+),score=36.16 GHUV01055651.1:174-578(+)
MDHGSNTTQLLAEYLLCLALQHSPVYFRQMTPVIEPTLLHACAADPNASEQLLVPTSPKSIEACFRLGIDPLELQFKPVANFKRAGETDELTQLRYQHHEELRQVGLGPEAASGRVGSTVLSLCTVCTLGKASV